MIRMIFFGFASIPSPREMNFAGKPLTVIKDLSMTVAIQKLFRLKLSFTFK